MSSRFLRCLKPNMAKKPDAFDGSAVLRQLRYTGMLECIHIRRAGFPISIPHATMVARMRPLLAQLPDVDADIAALEKANLIEAVRHTSPTPPTYPAPPLTTTPSLFRPHPPPP